MILCSNYFVSGGCLLSLSLWRRSFQDMLKISPFSLFMLCGCISNSVASLMSRSMYLVFVERSFVSCILIIWSWLLLCSAAADFSACASGMCLLAPLPHSNTGLFVPHSLVLLHASTLGCCPPQPVPVLRHTSSSSWLA